MRLTHWTDYSLRVLMYCAAGEQRDQRATVAEIAEAHGISRSHLTKIVMTLSGLGLLETTRGRGGGLRLLKPAQSIVVGEVVRQTETDFTLVECFDIGRNTCRLDGHCRLKGALREGMDRFLEVLDGVTLADLLEPMADLGNAQLVRYVPGLPQTAPRHEQEIVDTESR
ncbi:Rrf2 family transcriptional regulator [Variovorax sp. 3P27G3]|jgi:Rrf2 family nitric oxide-sensitive transcriptional repressor|uniref:Rrf2 family transcriptional regulator n=1 Tax=Variovorax sp. 3P27G3 TaxID=2502214 RepID=UPI0010F614AA|nr:Rrf2 family transcriptional regulator [Variovorax sp. 3P27G3]